jgi:hypothetical protein
VRGSIKKDVELVADDADAGSGLISCAQSAAGSGGQLTEPILRIEPERKIQIMAFVPDLYALASELSKSRHLFPECLGDRADHRHRPDLGELHPGVDHDVGRHAELPLQAQQVAVLLRDLGAPHGFSPEV